MIQTTPQPLPPGATLARGKYTIDRLLGQGGFGYVYLAHARQGQQYAIKQCTELTSEALMQFGHEIAVQKMLSSATFAAIHAEFTEKLPWANQPHDPDYSFVAMEYVPGKSLEDHLTERLQQNKGPFAEADVVHWMTQLLMALDHAHGKGIIHRDIKPANIMLLPDGKTIKVIDVGIAKIGGAGTFTQRGALGVSPGYSPPEQYARAGKTDAFSDVYAVGATMYHLLTGQLPLDAPARLSGQPLPRPRQLNSPITMLVEAVILKALELNVANRYQTPSEMLAALQGRATPAAMRVCPHCQGAMKAAAQFCPHCGKSSQVLTFPGSTVINLRDLVTACYKYWPEAIGQLTTGQLENWLHGQGADGQRLLQVIQSVRTQYPRDPNLQLDALLRQIDPTLPLPQLQVNPPQPSTVLLEQGNSHSAALRVTNVGQGYLVGNITGSDAWLTVKPAIIQCAAGQSQNCNVILDSTSLPGNRTGKHYVGQVTIQTNDGSQVIAYPIQVTATPKLAVTPKQIDFGKVALSQTLSQPLNVQNVGTGLLTVNIHSPVNWLQVSATTVTLHQQPQNIIVTALPYLIGERGAHSQTLHISAGGEGAEQVAVSLILTGPVTLSLAPNQPLDTIEHLLKWCDTHWDEAIRLLRNGELYPVVRYLGAPDRGRLRWRAAEPWNVVLTKVQQASTLRDDNLALETLLRALGAEAPKCIHNWCQVESQLGMGWRPDPRWLWPWWRGPGEIFLRIKNAGRGYLHGRVDSIVHWLRIPYPEFGCLAGQESHVRLFVDKKQRKLKGLTLEILSLQMD